MPRDRSPHPDCFQTRCCDALRFEIAHHTLGSFLGKILVELLAAGVVGISYYGDIGVGELLQIICDSVERGIGGCGKIAFAGLEKVRRLQEQV